MGQQSKAKAKRRLLAACRAKWVPRAMNTLPYWRWLTQLAAWIELQKKGESSVR